MNNTESRQDDDFLPEYDLKTLRVRKFGPARSMFPQHGVVLARGVESAFPDSNTVNEALRFLLRVTKQGEALSHAAAKQP